MGGSKSNRRSAQAWALAKRQHGLVTRGDLLRLGFSAKAIDHRISRGRLHPVMRGVYAVGWAEMTAPRRWKAALLACSPDAALSHRSAGALWGIAKERPGVIDLSVRRRCRHRRLGVHVRSRLSLRANEVVERRDIAVTSVVQTLVDLATELEDGPLERAVNEADKHGLIDAEALRIAVDDHAGEPGAPRLAALLGSPTFRLSDDGLEVLFRPLAARAGIPVDRTKETVNGFEVDFFWPELRLVVETDGLRYHRTPSQQARDSLRDQTHTAAGYTRLRFTHHQVAHEAPRVEAVLRATVARIRGAR
jgi:hypothetical protein